MTVLKIMSTSLQTVKKIKLKRDIQKILSILSVIFFLAFCCVFFAAVFTQSPKMETHYASSGYSISSYDSSYDSVSVGESSYGTYKNAQAIADNTESLLSCFSDFSAYCSEAQKKKDLFNTSYGLLGIAMFLLFVSISINQIWHLDADHKS